jgi:hypothetical protein
MTRSFKRLLRASDLGLYTPFWGAEIPVNGWLFPENNLRKQVYWDDIIRGGVIHSYMSKKWGFSGMAYESYSFGVVAFGKHGDMVSRALYIPDCDKRKKKSVDIIRALPYNLTKKILLEQLPILKKIERFL